MTIRRLPLALALGLTLLAPGAFAQESSPLDDVDFVHGPSTGDLGEQAEIGFPRDYVFADSKGTTQLMEMMENPVSGSELGFVGPEDLSWFVVFEFDESGYVKDDEKDALDADAMLKSIQEGNEESNKERRKRGWETLDITGWAMPPRYNEKANRLEWAIRGRSASGEVINHNTRLLGRDGVMIVMLVVDPQDYQAAIPKFDALLDDFEYKSGHKYAEYRQGDKIAKYGLSALVVGGAAAAAAKSGVFKWLWKILVIGGVAIAGFVRRLFGGGKEQNPTIG